MTNNVSLSNRIAAGINAFRAAGPAPQRPTAQAVSSESSSTPAERRPRVEQPTLRAGIPGENQSVPRGSYVNILV